MSGRTRVVTPDTLEAPPMTLPVAEPYAGFSNAQVTPAQRKQASVSSTTRAHS